MNKGCYIALLLFWTLWTHSEGANLNKWEAAPGLASQEKCQASMNDKLEMWKQFKDSKFGKNSVTFTNNNTTMTYQCLAEDQDPRKAKPTKGKTKE